MNKHKNKVTILLSRYGDPFSRFVELFSRCIYTHCSISLDPEENEFYSFNLKGFIVEHWHGKKSKHLRPERRALHLYVSDEIFEKLREEIKKFEKRKAELSYSPLGTILCVFRIPSNFKKRYFCTRFVAEVLRNSGAAKLKRKNSLYLPVHFLKEFEA